MDRLLSKTASDVIRCLKGQFARHGRPEIVFSDNGPPFVSKDFKYFMKILEISHHTFSPRYLQSNGRVENSVKVVKNLMSKAIEDSFLALLDWRNTLSEATLSAQVVFGRRTRTLMPISDSLLQTPNSTRIRETMKAVKLKQAALYNMSAKERPSLNVGQSDWQKGSISKVLPYRS